MTQQPRVTREDASEVSQDVLRRAFQVFSYYHMYWLEAANPPLKTELNAITVRNAALESSLMSIRDLDDFFGGNGKQKDDVNAVYHRSYEEREPIEVRVMPDEILVQSFPGPDRSIPIEELRAGRPVGRRYRNRRIGEFLKELELSEGRNTGIPTIQKAMADNGSPAARFETDENRTYLLVRLPLRPAPEPKTAQTSGTVRTKSALSRHPVTDPVGDPVTRILRALADGALSPAAIQQKLGIKHRPTFRKNYLRPALAQGLLEMTLPDKPSSRLQKYRTTDAGRARLAQNT